VYVHWSVFAVTAVMMLSAIENAAATLFAVSAYLGVLLLHEWGHLVAAQRRRCAVWSIELYPLHGFTRISAPASHYDACVIAWGGVLAQLTLAAPLIVAVTIFGFTPIGPLNALIAMFGYFSAMVAVLNLFPVPRLDGATAWQIVPHLWRRWVRSGVASRDAPSRRKPNRKATPPRNPWVH
jgi:Zn-dependent protease